ncbi:hypothetical protein DER46DRAFT_614984, partial [Fusarium sp. MPI-SDFR-AT-0072]
MEFITISHPSQCASADLRRRANSHAARVAHSRNPRARLMKDTHEQKKAEHRTVLAQPNTRQTSMKVNMVTNIPMSVSSALGHEPLASFLKSLTTRDRFLFDHYVHVVAPQQQQRCTFLSPLSKAQEYVRRNWVFVCSGNIELLKGFLLSAARSLAMLNDQEFKATAVQYKLRFIQALQQSLSAGDLSSLRSAVPQALVLAFDETMAQNRSIASKHILGAVHIIQAIGGPEKAELDSIVYFLLFRCVFEKSIVEKIL